MHCWNRRRSSRHSLGRPKEDRRRRSERTSAADCPPNRSALIRPMRASDEADALSAPDSREAIFCLSTPVPDARRGSRRRCAGRRKRAGVDAGRIFRRARNPHEISTSSLPPISSQASADLPPSARSAPPQHIVPRECPSHRRFRCQPFFQKIRGFLHFAVGVERSASAIRACTVLVSPLTQTRRAAWRRRQRRRRWVPRSPRRKAAARRRRPRSKRGL
jgi:hypothetical protein